MQVVDRNGRLKVEITSTVDDLSVGVTTISGGTNGRVLYDNAGVLGEIAGTSTQYIAGDGSLITFPTTLAANKMVTVGRNSTGSTLYKGTIVYISGSTGNLPNFVKAQANSEATSAGTFGVIESDIANNADGNCVTIGTIDNLDTRSTATHPFTTDTLADGDTIYLSPTTAGYITNVKPYAPSHLVYVGKVVRTSPTNGTIVYRIQNGYELDELHDVAAQTPSNNDALAFETSTQLWKPKSITTLLGFTPVPTSRTLTINGTTQDLSADRTFTISTGITIGTTAITSGTVGRVLFEGTGNVVQESANLFWDNTNGRLGIGTSSPTAVVHSVGSVTASSLIARGNYIQPTLIPNANNSQLIGLQVDISASAGGFTNVLGWGLILGNLLDNNLRFQRTIYGTSLRNSINSYTAGTANNSLLLQDISSGTTSIGAGGGNVLIGTTTDAGFKLDVNGTARIVTSLVVGGTGSGSLTTSVVRCNYLNTSDNGFSVMQLQTLSGNATFFQSVSIGSGANPIASAQLEVSSTTKGFLPPRMTTTQKNAIASPATGLMVYDTTLNLMALYNGTTWTTL